MNIGIFTDSYYPQVNGVVTSIMTLKKELEELGHKVTVVTISHPEAEWEEGVLRLPSIPFLPLKNHRVGSIYSNRILKEIKALDLDIIHTQTEFSLGKFARIVGRKLNIPIVHTYHTMYEDYIHYIAFGPMIRPVSRLAKRVSRVYCQSCDTVIVPTNKVRSKLREYGLINKKIDVIPTGIDFTPFLKSNFSKERLRKLREECGIKENEKVVLFVGRIAKEKSIDVIIKAMPSLIKKVDNCKLLIVGGGPERSNLEELSKELGVENNVIFAGEKPWKDIGMYYQLGDAFVSASVTETQGLTFIEAMAAEIPVVAKYDKNLEDFMKNEENGIIFRNDDELTQVLNGLFTSNELSESVVLGANKTIKSMSSENFAKNVLQTYMSTIAEYANYDLINEYKKVSN